MVSLLGSRKQEMLLPIPKPSLVLPHCQESRALRGEVERVYQQNNPAISLTLRTDWRRMLTLKMNGRQKYRLWFLLEVRKS